MIKNSSSTLIRFISPFDHAERSSGFMCMNEIIFLPALRDFTSVNIRFYFYRFNGLLADRSSLRRLNDAWNHSGIWRLTRAIRSVLFQYFFLHISCDGPERHDRHNKQKDSYPLSIIGPMTNNSEAVFLIINIK
jgi:hypothetical protein